MVPDTYQDVEKVILDNSQLLDIANKTKSFLEGFYSDFGLELLSSVDYLLSVFGNEMTNEQIYAQMEKWSDRRARLFADIRYIDIARRHILTR